MNPFYTLSKKAQDGQGLDQRKWTTYKQELYAVVRALPALEPLPATQNLFCIQIIYFEANQPACKFK